jgi:hypothetical protein
VVCVDILPRDRQGIGRYIGDVHPRPQVMGAGKPLFGKNKPDPFLAYRVLNESGFSSCRESSL